MKTFDNDIFEENTMSPAEAAELSQKLSEVSKEIKDTHAWLGDTGTRQRDSDLEIEVQPLTIRHTPLSAEAMLDGAKLKLDPTVGWLKPSDGGLEVSINVETKLKHWLQEHGEIRLRIKKLFQPTAYSATHRCVFVGKAHTRPIVADVANRALAVVKDGSIDDFEFSVSPATLESFIYRWKGKVWLKLYVKNQQSSVWVYCQ